MWQKRTLPVLAIVVLALVTYLYSINDGTGDRFWDDMHFLSDTSPGSQPHWGQSVGLVVTMIVGIVFGALYELIQTRQGHRVMIHEVLEAMVTSRSFWLAILAAPFALFLVLSFKSGITGGVEHYAFAFQNGFFVKTLIPSPKPE